MLTIQKRVESATITFNLTSEAGSSKQDAEDAGKEVSTNIQEVQTLAHLSMAGVYEHGGHSETIKLVSYIVKGEVEQVLSDDEDIVRVEVPLAQLNEALEIARENKELSVTPLLSYINLVYRADGNLDAFFPPEKMPQAQTN